MKKFISRYINQLISDKLVTVWDALKNNNQILERYGQNLKEIHHVLEEYGQNLEDIHRVSEEYGQNLKSNNQILDGYGQNIKNNNQVLEEYGRGLEDIYQVLGEYGQNLKNSNERLEEQGLNISNNNKMLEMMGKNLKKINPFAVQMPELYERLERLDNKVDMHGVKIAKMKKERLVGNKIGNKQSDEEKLPIKIIDNYTSVDYFEFENYFRGSREHIKQVQKIYLPYFKGCDKVVDLGCGRGEFLELLKENGIGAVGVDFYEEFADYCVMKGFDVKRGDAIEFLENIEEVDGIFAGQLIEHLHTNQVIKLCQLAFDKLKEGSYAIFETPNPTSLAIYTNSFYIDPSHEKPVHPLTMEYFMKKAGFKDIDIVFTESSKVKVDIPQINIGDNQDEFNGMMDKIQDILFGSQDYAIIVRK